MKKVGDKAENFSIEMISGMVFDLDTALKHGPVVLNFIMGTWCPTCTMHISRIRRWQDSYEQGKATILTISAEADFRLKAYVEKTGMTLLFASDLQQEVIRSFGLHIPVMKISRPATILIDQGRVIRMMDKGIRSNRLVGRVEKECEVCALPVLEKNS